MLKYNCRGMCGFGALVLVPWLEWSNFSEVYFCLETFSWLLTTKQLALIFRCHSLRVTMYSAFGGCPCPAMLPINKMSCYWGYFALRWPTAKRSMTLCILLH